MTAEAAFGGALLASGWLLSQGLASAHRHETLRQLGVEEIGERSRRSLKSRLLSLTDADGRLLLLLVAAGAGTLGYLLMGPVGLLAGSFAGPAVVRGRKAQALRHRQEMLHGQLAEAITTIAAALRAGLSVRRAVAEASDEALPPLREELEAVVHRLDTGEPLDKALARMSRRLGLSDAVLLVNGLAVHRRSGGELPTLLDEIARLIRVRLDDRRSLRVLTAQARSSGVVLAVLPVAFVALLSGTGGDGLGAFYRSAPGAVLLLFAMCFEALGFAWMQRIVRDVEAT